MKVFQQSEVDAAIQHAMHGGQSIHLHRLLVGANPPRCFVESYDRGENLAHLFDQEFERLRETAMDLGVKEVVVERIGRPGQHVDLCGGPLKRALRKALEQRQGSLFAMNEEALILLPEGYEFKATFREIDGDA